MVDALPLVSYALLKYIARHLWHVSQLSHENLMGVSNLAIVFGKEFSICFNPVAPSILRPKKESAESAMCLPRIFPVVEAMIQDFQYLFEVCGTFFG